MPKACPFCSVPEDRVIATEPLVYAIPDKYPVSPGHTLIIPRRHFASWFDATTDERTALMELADRIRTDLDRKRSPAGYNIGINVGRAAGQTIMHLHVHLIPRYHRDVDDPRGGVRYAIPDKGNYEEPGRVPKSEDRK